MRISDWSSDVCSSDLRDSSGGAALVEIIGHAGGPYDPPLRLTAIDDDEVAVDEAPGRGGEIGNRLGHVRSEEHTSELQSLMRISYAVFCLKKKKMIKHT